MRVAVVQPSYIPWRGYFDLIASVDLFVFYDDVQYTKNDWRNRNRIKTHLGLQWLTLPVRHRSLDQKICETEVINPAYWLEQHSRHFQASYNKAPYVDQVLEFFARCHAGPADNIATLCMATTRDICQSLGITTTLMASSGMGLTGRKTERLIDLLTRLNASSYLSGPSAEAYIDKDLFRAYGIGLEYKSYNYAPYPQLWGDFEGAVSILDLIANCGPQARYHLSSATSDRCVVNPLSPRTS